MLQIKQEVPYESLSILALQASNDPLVKWLQQRSAIWQKKEQADISQLSLNVVSTGIVQQDTPVGLPSACIYPGPQASWKIWSGSSKTSRLQCTEQEVCNSL